MVRPAGVSTIEEALRECGVTSTTLDPAEKAALDRDGCLLLRDLLDAERLARLRSAFEAAAPRGNAPVPGS